MIKIFKSTFLLTICLSLLSMYSYSAPYYRLVDLGLQESDQSEAMAVNDHGVVLGKYKMNGIKHFFLWTQDNGVKLIDLPQTTDLYLLHLSLNNKNQIAGEYTDQQGNLRGFFWDSSEGLTDIGTLGGSKTSVSNMNDKSQIVGWSLTHNKGSDGNPEKHAFLWEKGNMIDLGALQGDLGLQGDQSEAVCINNNGMIIGKSNYLLAHKGKLIRSALPVNVIWRNGIIEEFELPQENCGELFSINDKNLITFNGLSSHSVFDLNSKCSYAVAGGYYSKITNSGFILSRGAPPIITILKYVTQKGALKILDNKFIYIYDEFKNILNFPWKEFNSALDVNNNGWVVGSAINIYDESHAILLLPINYP